MVVNSSALIAVLLDEPEADAFRRIMLGTSRVGLSAVTYVEASIVIAGRAGSLGLDCLNDLLNGIQAEIIPFDGQQAQFAVDAWQRFGKGPNPACLNFGDCYSYALPGSWGNSCCSRATIFPRRILSPPFLKQLLLSNRFS